MCLTDQAQGLSRGAIFQSVERSLARLGTDYIDVLQIQRLDESTPASEYMRAFHDLVASGKVRYIGASSMWATQFVELQALAEAQGWTKFVSMQNYYNLCYREEEREMNRYCQRTGVGLMPWSPLFSGRLTRPASEIELSQRSKMPFSHIRSLSESDEAIISRVEQLAKRKNYSMTEVALLWLKQKGTAPIVGLNSVARVNEMNGLRGKRLEDAEISYLEEMYVPRPVAGHT
jgi:aryl-alcohol dehydrogenase-like predicted oxidoreductase